MLLGNLTDPILVIISKQDVMGKAENIPLAGYSRMLLEQAFKKGRIPLDQIAWCLVDDIHLIRQSEARVLVPVGERALARVCGLNSQHKWWGSVIRSTSEFSFRKCIPMLDPEYTEKVYAENAYNAQAATKIYKEMSYPWINSDPRIIHFKMSYAEAMSWLEQIYLLGLTGSPLGIDLENFSTGVINTVGIAISPTEAIALRIDPGYWEVEQEFNLWKAIARILEEPRIAKVLQNHIYELLYFSRYGIRMQGTSWDTMWAMRVLYPEFSKGLDNVARFFTDYPYWKDDKDDWSQVKDWVTHLTYNGRDTTGTLAAYYNQVEELKERGLYDFFTNYGLKLMPMVAEMCSRGIPVNEFVLHHFIKEAQTKIDVDMEVINRITMERLGRTINIRSPAQLQKALKEMGMVLPMKSSKEGDSKESADKKSLNKLKRKYPEEGIIDSLIRISKENKAMSSYLEFTYDTEKKIANYTFDGLSTETLRMASYTDNWGRGFNVQTIPKLYKKIFSAPEGRIFIEIDLSQAESRFVAWDSPEPKLIDMINSKQDIHKYVASHIHQIPVDQVTDAQRQLGKKSGHAANYGVGPKTFAEACLVEMGLVISDQRAKEIINAYFSLFPGVKKRQNRIQTTLRNHRKITTSFGFERYFFGYLNDSMFREGYAFDPQSTIPYIVNHLALFLMQEFRDLWIHQQGHDAILVSVFPEMLNPVLKAATSYDLWHPKIELAGGPLIIPIEAEYGTSWKPMTKAVL